ncbi:MAG: ATPase [Spirochaetaceae bacterium]|nr:hypothetical protein [Myxococcales bacterium]MCB9723086.1 ATPase [Spirochaetaceae bacterium]HPG24158.1 BCAM0308 family protein [Myxococcota bacterium]
MAHERSKTHSAASQPRQDRHLRDHTHDTYGLRGKLSDPSACRTCGASYHEGRWTWRPAPVDAFQTTCPACRRAEDGQPAGLVTLEGPFLKEHRAEIEGLIRNLEEREKAEHPLKRVLSIEPRDDGAVEVATSDVHLARGIGRALHDAYQGEVDYGFTEIENLCRVHWRR